MKSAILFPGQGSQYPGMGKSLYQDYEEARLIFEEANDTLGFDLQRMCFEGRKEELDDTVNTQPAVLTVSIAAHRILKKELGIEPSYAAGHSLGEYSALVASGALPFSTALRLVRRRGQFMRDAMLPHAGAMYVVMGIKHEHLEQYCQQISRADMSVVISCYNSPSQHIISGQREAVEQVAQQLERVKVKCLCLNAHFAFHSPLMQRAAEQMRQELAKHSFIKGAFPVISNVTALPYESIEQMLALLPEQITNPVRWKDTIDYLEQQGVTQTIELGPKTVLSQLLRDQTRGITPYALGKSEDVQQLKRKGTPQNDPPPYPRHRYQQFITKCLAYAISTKNHNWNEEEYQQGVILPYRKLKAYKQQLEHAEHKLSKQQIVEAYDMLRSVLATKKLPLHEQNHILQQLLEETQTRAWFQLH